MKMSERLQEYVWRAKQRDSYWVEQAKLEFSIHLEDTRKKAGLTYKALADKLESSPSYITKVFRGDANLTIESMVKLARATGGELKIEISIPAETLTHTRNPWAKTAAIALPDSISNNDPYYSGTGVSQIKNTISYIGTQSYAS